MHSPQLLWRARETDGERKREREREREPRGQVCSRCCSIRLQPLVLFGADQTLLYVVVAVVAMLESRALYFDHEKLCPESISSSRRQPPGGDSPPAQGTLGLRI